MRSDFFSRDTITWIAIVALSYVAAARVGLTLDAVSGFAALVWPASGIALAALLLGGVRLWPAVAIGAFVANYTAGAPFVPSAGIAMGNTIAAIAASVSLRRMPGFDLSMQRVRDVIALIVAGIGSGAVAATLGVGVLALSGMVPAGRFAETWRAWWVGDAIGDIVTTPLILVWVGWRIRLAPRRRIAEAAGLGIFVVAASLVVFGTIEGAAELIERREYMLFPPLIWAALRFGVRGSVTASAIVMVIAIVRTTAGHGPFIAAELHESLLALQIFMGISGSTFLLLGASISERRRMTLALGAAREKAETANRAKAGFLAAMSHELRTPLNAITGYVDLLSLGLDGPLTDKQRAALSRISQSQNHLVRLIEDVLDFAQVEAGRLSFTLGPVIVKDAIASIEPLIGPELVKKGLTLRVKEFDQAMMVRADPDKLRQVLLNLAANAMKFSSSGGEIVISATDHGASVHICVSDTGIGIPEDSLGRVFDPFFQVEQGATRRYPGLGLGLSIVRDVVLAMDGDVTIASTPGKGTEVSVILPLLKSSDAMGEPTESYPLAS